MINIRIKTILFFLFISALTFAQSRTNLEMLNKLVDSSAYAVSSKILDLNKEYNVEYEAVAEYSALNKRVKNSFVRNGIAVNFDNTINKISYSILLASVTYSDLFKDGLFGEYLLERKFILSGEYSIEKSSSVLSADTFYYTVTDTIPYNSLNLVENNSLPFTKSNVPPEPLFPSLLEPIVAVTAVVVTVVLFFTVRSN